MCLTRSDEDVWTPCVVSVDEDEEDVWFLLHRFQEATGGGAGPIQGQRTDGLGEKIVLSSVLELLRHVLVTLCPRTS